MANNVMNMDGNFKPFRVWCQHVLPTVYDDSLSYMELLNKVINYINQFGEYLEEFSALNAITYEGVWDITKQYKAWSVVSVNNEAGYISIKPVPAGVQITNTEYWELIADYTAIIAGLAERVVALEAEDVVLDGKITTTNGRIDATNTRVGTLEGQMTTVNNNITALGNRVTATETSITKLNGRVGDWSDRKIIYVSDSWGRGRTYPNTYSTSWCDQVDTKLQPAASYNMSVSGARWSDTIEESLRFGKQLETFVNGHTEAECEAITDIIIGGGINDLYSASSDIANATSNYCAVWTANYINQHFPNATVHQGFISRIPIFANSTTFSFNNYRDVIQKYKDMCVKFGWKYIVESEFMCHEYEEITNDGIHLKTSGYIKLGNRIAEYLNNGSWDYPQTAGANINIKVNTSTDNNSVIITNTPEVYNQYTRDGVLIFTNGACRFMFDATNINTQTPLYLGKYFSTGDEIYNHFVCQYTYRIYCKLNFYKNYVLQHSIDGYMVFDPNGNVWLGAMPGQDFANTECDMIYLLFSPVLLSYSMT